MFYRSRIGGGVHVASLRGTQTVVGGGAVEPERASDGIERGCLVHMGRHYRVKQKGEDQILGRGV